MRRPMLSRPIWLPLAVSAFFLFLSLALMNGTALRGLKRLDPIHTHLIGFTEVQDLLLLVQKMLLSHISDGNNISPQDITTIRQHIGEIIQSNKLGATLPGTDPLQKAYAALSEPNAMPIPALAEVITELDVVIRSETKIHTLLLADARKSAQLELDLAATTLIILFVLGILLYLVIRKRILTPLKELGWLMSQLARQDYAPAHNTIVDPLLQPLVGHYNQMVGRLAELEQEHATRHASLESQIRGVAGHLLEQQRTLANAERLAAVGELAAQLAHHLRNPIAGIHLALTNLSEELDNTEHAARVNLMSRELERINSLLNTLLNQSRHLPEATATVNIARITAETFALVRYQIPDRIILRHELPIELEWSLPENEFRRTLLNLLLNSYQAIGDKNGSVVISCNVDKETLTIELRDDGPGFSEKFLKTGIRAFVTTRTEGTGLGLESVQRFMNVLQGKLLLRNVVPHGACVTLIIPTPQTSLKHAE